MKKDPQLAKILIEDLRDAAINTYLDIDSGWTAAPALKKIHEDMKGMDEPTRLAVRKAVAHAIASGPHDFLFRLQELHEDGVEIGLYEGGTNIAQESDGLHGELFSSEGWIAKYSQHKDA